MKKNVFFLLSFCLIISCAGNQVKKQAQFSEARIIKAQYTNLFKATRDYLFERGYELTKTNMNTGEVETDYRPGAGWINSEIMDSDKFIFDKKEEPLYLKRRRLRDNVNLRDSERRARVLAKVIKIDDKNSKLMIDIVCEIRDSGTNWLRISSDIREARIMYNQFFKGIIVKAKKEIKSDIIPN